VIVGSNEHGAEFPMAGGAVAQIFESQKSAPERRIPQQPVERNISHYLRKFTHEVDYGLRSANSRISSALASKAYESLTSTPESVRVPNCCNTFLMIGTQIALEQFKWTEGGLSDGPNENSDWLRRVELPDVPLPH
jgi:hypothetical protein